MEPTRQINLRLAISLIESLDSSCAERNLSRSEIVTIALQHYLGNPSKAVHTDSDTADKFCPIVTLETSGGKLWPVVHWSQYLDWTPGMSYWNRQRNYVWSGQFDSNEMQNLMDFYLSPRSNFGRALAGPWNSLEEYEAARQKLRSQASTVAQAFINCANSILDQQAKGEEVDYLCYPPIGM